MQSIQELYLQYWNGITRVFPAVPEDWKDISFKNLRTSGAFLISAIRKNGKNTEVSIYSEKGGQIKIKPNFEGLFTTSGSGNLIQQNNSVYVYEVPKGKTLTLKRTKRKAFRWESLSFILYNLRSQTSDNNF